MLVLVISGKAHSVFIKLRLIAHLCGHMTLGEYLKLQGELLKESEN